MDLGDIFDEAFDLYKRNFLSFLLLCACVLLPVLIVLEYAWQEGIGPGLLLSIRDTLDGRSADVMTPLGRQSVVMLILAAAFSVAWSAMTAAASETYLNQSTSLGTSYLTAMRRLGSVLPATVIVGILFALGCMVCVIPALLVAVFYVFYLQTIVVEKLGWWRGMRRSAQLAGADSGRVFSMELILVTVYAMIAAALSIVIQAGLTLLLQAAPGLGGLASALQSPLGPSSQSLIIHFIGNDLTVLLLTPFVVCLITVLYYDVRVRREAFDIEVLAERLDYAPIPADVAAAASAVFAPVRPVRGAMPPGVRPYGAQPGPNWGGMSPQGGPGWGPAPPQGPGAAPGTPGWRPAPPAGGPGWGPAPPPPGPAYAPPAAGPPRYPPGVDPLSIPHPTQSPPASPAPPPASQDSSGPPTGAPGGQA